MTKHIKKLVAKEFVVEEQETVTFEEGFKYVYLVDPQTGKFYEPKPGYEVTGDKLEQLFEEVAAG